MTEAELATIRHYDQSRGPKEIAWFPIMTDVRHLIAYVDDLRAEIVTLRNKLHLLEGS